MYLLCENENYTERAKALADRMKVELTSSREKIGDDDLHLELSDEGLSLRHGTLSMSGDFTELIPRIKKSNLDNEMLVKAARLKNYTGSGMPVLLDATAGMGEDSFILAAAGFKVILYEYDVIIASLLEDALLRASQKAETAHIAARMELRIGDSIAAMNALDPNVKSGTEDDRIEADAAEGKINVILLDPMFPARTKSAMVKKKFQLLQQLEKPCADEDDIMKAAIMACPDKIIIKRPAKGPYLAGMKPDYSMDGKAIRYDCMINVESRKKKITK